MLDPLVLPLPKKLPSETAGPAALSFHHLRLDSTPDDLLNVLYTEFSEEVERGNTYPQEGPLSLDSFKAYFYSADVFVAIGVNHTAKTYTLDEARADRPWNECVYGFYYICNAGFVVPKISRGKGVGIVLGTSYLHFAPKLGYRASVFNLVYDTNKASLAIWTRLEFKVIGVVPQAGRLKQEDGSEKYVDANVIYKSFSEE